VEKPLCGTNDESKQMMEAEKKTGHFIAVGFQDIYDWKVRLTKQAVLDGKVGRIKRIRGWAHWPRGQSYYARNSWAGKVRVGDQFVFDSPFNNAMAHFLNLLLFFGGKSMPEMAEITQLEAELFRARGIESFDTGSLLAQTDTGIQLIFHGTHSCRENIPPRIWIEGEKGTLLWNFDGSVKMQTDQAEVSLCPAEPPEKKLQSMIESVLARVSDPEQWICRADMAAAHTRLINRLHQDFQIRDLPSSSFDLQPDDPEQFPVIHQIQQHTAQASTTGSLLGRWLLA
jgi:predicted dehydrogenase